MGERIAVREMAEGDCPVIANAFTAQGWSKPVSQYLRYWVVSDQAAEIGLNRSLMAIARASGSRTWCSFVIAGNRTNQVAEFHHRKLPTRSTLLAGHTPPDEVGFQSRQLQIWYNITDQSWVGEGEAPHLHTESDECFIVLRGALVVEVDGQRHTVGPRAFCCFPSGVLHAIVEVQTPVETLMIRAPSIHDKIYEVNRPKDVNRQ